MSRFFDSIITGFTFGMFANNPFFGRMGCFGGYSMMNTVDFGGFANSFPCIFPPMQNIGGMSGTPILTEFANPTFPSLDFNGACSSIWDTFTNPNSEYNKRMSEMYKEYQKQMTEAKSSDKQYIPQMQFPFSSFYMPSQIAMNPWITGWNNRKPVEEKKEESEKEKEPEKTDVSANAQELKNKWSKKQPQLTDEFYSKVVSISQKVKCSADDLMALMNLETARTFSPTAKNPTSTATGLIQFTKDAAKNLGTTISDLEKMTAVQQLDYVEKYLVKWKKTVGIKDNERLSSGDLYALVFRPGYINRDALAKKGSVEYSKNRSLDVNKDNKITKQDLSERLKEFMA